MVLRGRQPRSCSWEQWRAAGPCPVSLACAVTLAAVVILTGCNLIPSRPDAVYILYRERLKSQKPDEARALLTEESRRLAVQIATAHKLNQAPEELALLNALDPVTPPVNEKTTDTLAVLRVRTLKGGSRLVRLVRHDTGSKWQIDLSAELTSLRSFLQAQQSLEMIREQAGEFASSWKAFTEQLNLMPIPEPDSGKQPPPKSTPPRPQR